MSSEQSNKSFYITTTLPYVNADPHIGFALEAVEADVIARYKRIQGFDVFFNSGTDEHGQKNWTKAQKEGKDIKDYLDLHAEKFTRLKTDLNLTYDNFVRTTEPFHYEAAQELWNLSKENEDIYKKKYKGIYCVGHEAFITEKELVEGKCPEHPNMDLETIEEENYFFRFSKYEQELLEYLKREESIIPEFRKKEAISFVEAGLEDFSISRLKEKMPWGVPVPDDSEHIMYVWFDALANYISTLGWPNDINKNFEKFWVNGETLQMAGKDQIRFQSLMWQAILISAGLPTTNRIFYHGFITSNGRKMSKSIGNVINPEEAVTLYGKDAVRYFLLRHIHPFEDSDITFEKMTEWFNANLANGIGNLLSRIFKMYVEYEVEIAFSKAEDVWDDKEFEEYKNHIEHFEFQKATDYLWEGVNGLDSFIAEQEPYRVVKTDKEKAQELVAYCALKLYEIGVLLEPLMPETSIRIRTAFETRKLPEPLFERKQ